MTFRRYCTQLSVKSRKSMKHEYVKKETRDEIYKGPMPYNLQKENKLHNDLEPMESASVFDERLDVLNY